MPDTTSRFYVAVEMDDPRGRTIHFAPIRASSVAIAEQVFDRRFRDTIDGGIRSNRLLEVVYSGLGWQIWHLNRHVFKSNTTEYFGLLSYRLINGNKEPEDFYDFPATHGVWSFPEILRYRRQLQNLETTPENMYFDVARVLAKG